MDYDDNDFQGHNIQLAGEGSSKFSSVLHPYALPKLDFDDSLPGHLRFDSLVENEVFLGIPSQEDNQWIEDFSRGTSGIEFSSSVAESCFISRHFNVWSEATSSESVEMLLKSIGQGEIVPGETIVEEPEAGNELLSLTKQMEPNLIQDDASPLVETIAEEPDAADESGSLTKQMEPNPNKDDTMENVIDSQSVLPPDELLENFSGLDEGGEVEHRDTKSASRTQAAELSASAHGSSNASDPDAVSEKCGLIMTTKKMGIDRKCDDSNQREADASANESLNYKAQEDPAVPGVQIGSIDSSSQNVIANVGNLNELKILHKASDICFENVNALAKDICKGVEEHNLPSQGANQEDQLSSKTISGSWTYSVDTPHCVSSKVESFRKPEVKGSNFNSEATSSLPLKGDFDFQIAEECNVDVLRSEPCPGSKCEVLVFSKGTKINEQVVGNAHEESPVVFQGDTRFLGHAIEAGSTKAGNLVFQELKVDSPMQITHGQCSSIEEKENFFGSDSQIDRKACVSNSEKCIFSAIGDQPLKQGDESNINLAGDFSSVMVACSSAEMLKETPAIDNMKGSNYAPGVDKEDSDAEDCVLRPKLAGSMQICNEKLFEQGDSTGIECGVIGSLDNDKRVGSSFSGEGVEDDVVIADGPEFDTNTTNKPELDVAAGATTLASRDTYDGVPSRSGSGVTADGVTDCNEEKKSSVLGVGFTHLDKKEEMEIEVPRDANLSTLKVKESSQVAYELGPDSEFVKDASCDCAVQKLHKAAGQSVPIVEVRYASSERAAADEVSQQCSKKLGMSPFLCDLAKKEGDGAETVAFEDHKETSVERNQKVAYPEVAVDTSNDHKASTGLVRSSECDANHSLEAGGNSADSDKPNCNSQNIISCIKLSNSCGNKQAVKETMIENVPLSEVSGGVDGKVQSISMSVSGNRNSNEEKSFTFEVSPMVGLTDAETGMRSQSFPTIHACEKSAILVGSPSASGGGQMDTKIAEEISHGPPQGSDGMIPHGGAKGTPARKMRHGFQMDAKIAGGISHGTQPQGSDGMIPHGGAKGTPAHKMRRGSSKVAGKENAKKGKHVKETTPVKQLERVDKSCVSMSPLRTGQLVQCQEMKPNGNLKSIGAKPCVVISVPASDLPDVNTSVPPSVLFQQPFTDMQQVQLGAQIFVYGSLIQGAAPDEAYMVSAFGPSDRMRHVWEPAWCACLERLQRQKSYANNSESPAQSRSGTITPQANKQGPLQSKVVSSPVGRASSKGTLSSVVSPMIPLPSPLWNLSTPSSDGLQSGGMPRSPLLGFHQTLSPLHPNQAPPLQNFVGQNPSWLSQASFTGPWVASPQNSSFDVGAHFSGFHITEAVKLTPVKESFLPVSATKHASPIPMAHSEGPNVSAGASDLLDVKKDKASPGHHSTDKARKRKRVPATVDLGQNPFPPQSQIGSASDPAISSHLVKKVRLTKDLRQISLLARSPTELVSAPLSHFSTSVTVTSAAYSASEGNSGKILSAVSPTSSSIHPQREYQTVENKDIVLAGTSSKGEEAMVQAEDAASHAAAAVSRCQDVWRQLDKQKKSGLVSDIEAKVASAAAAISAAASVAKAAAAAAKIASDAAIQAKLMADEAVFSSENVKPTQIVSNLEKATSATILKGRDGSNYSSSIIFAAREAARKRVEAASAASKHAENLDAIIKAAELTAEAASQAGKILAMGDPLPLSELVESDSEGYGKVTQVPTVHGIISNNVNRDQFNTNSVEQVPCHSAKHPNEGPSDKEMHTTNHGMSPLPTEISRNLKDDHMMVVDGISSYVTSSDKDSRGQKGHRASGLDQTISVLPKPEFALKRTSGTARDESENATGLSIQDSITKGCFIEVFKDGGNCKAAWFSANVLSLADGKALVNYTDLQSDEGSEQLKELVPLEDDGDNPPRIRIAHPVTTMRSDGTKKRRREAMTDYAWSVGDRVDAWTRNCWREGFVTEKKNETTLTVHFPVEREVLVVRAWHLRPSLLWKDGKWIESSNSRGGSPSQGDTPQEKRLKPSSAVIEGKGKDKMSNDIILGEAGKHEESRLLPSSADEKILDVHNNTRVENNFVRLRVQKGVNIGVPKPGKKTKFMEVNKHYVSERSGMSNLANDSVKFAKYLMPRGSRERKNSSKIDANYKQAAESKHETLKSGKPLFFLGRTLPQKDRLLTSPKAALSAATTTNSVSNDEKKSGQQKLMEFGFCSDAEDAAEGPVLFSSHALRPDASSEEMPLSDAQSEWLNKVKHAEESSGKSAKVEGNAKSFPNVIEPRRSNRRIQPTSRLLEGLQSSLIASKILPVSNEKTHRSQNRASER